MTDQQLPDAVAIEQVTPGPVFTTATFVALFMLFRTRINPAWLVFGGVVGLAS